MMDRSSSETRRATLAELAARVLLTLALASLVGAWVTQVTGKPLLGIPEQHLFGDAIVFALLGVGAFLDAFWHARYS